MVPQKEMSSVYRQTRKRIPCTRAKPQRAANPPHTQQPTRSSQTATECTLPKPTKTQWTSPKAELPHTPLVDVQRNGCLERTSRTQNSRVPHKNLTGLW
ncbi:Hypothetical predicted protein [Pelobates cultripes]|uniref:Uncharacterized protein n=1 Tax=Pelobates cultripes TaxID=61616 RepID=A0AAD1SDU9_PELCU|nr:Hypothetical predicted protein [Pelobates cultripes]